MALKHGDLKCSEQNCNQDAEFYVWFVNYGGLYSYRCKAHLVYLLQTSPYPIQQVQRIDYSD
jgi:hypothetical protein